VSSKFHSSSYIYISTSSSDQCPRKLLTSEYIIGGDHCNIEVESLPNVCDIVKELLESLKNYSYFAGRNC
jgi:hypothetical protein